ncbi:hypothetical protein EVA_03033 [gut metagenome]|uniref:Uncharacterized protein n=1 Tax=gut metagenome TaxID=749906 RepID=J9GMR2_9ZZZZ
MFPENPSVLEMRRSCRLRLCMVECRFWVTVSVVWSTLQISPPFLMKLWKSSREFRFWSSMHCAIIPTILTRLWKKLWTWLIGWKRRKPTLSTCPIGSVCMPMSIGSCPLIGIWPTMA